MADHSESEHLPAQGDVAAQLRALNVLDDRRNTQPSQRFPGLGDELRVLAAAVGAGGEDAGCLTRWAGVDRVELVAVGGEEFQGVCAVELERVVRLLDQIDSDDVESGVVVALRRRNRTSPTAADAESPSNWRR